MASTSETINTDSLRKTRRINLAWMMELYKAYPEKERFFDRTQSTQMGNIDGLAGTTEFKKDIIAGKTVEQIQDSWEPNLGQFKAMRKKYL